MAKEIRKKKGRVENLRPAQTGEVRNPAGRPKGAKDGLRAHLRRYLKANPNASIMALLEAKGIDTKRFKGKDNAAAIVEALIAEAVSGNVKAMLLAFTQTEEPLKTTVDVNQRTFNASRMKAMSREELIASINQGLVGMAGVDDDD